MASALGDITPRLQGRLTLNPMSHIDPMGLLCMFLVHFGWAKPVAINPYNFKNPRTGDILVSLAGPFANFLTAFITMAALLAWVDITGNITGGARQVLSLIILYNVNFGVFNLIPIPPLDGSRVVMELLPPDLSRRLMGLERYSFIILIVFLMTPLPMYILSPLVHFVLRVMGMILTPFF